MSVEDNKKLVEQFNDGLTHYFQTGEMKFLDYVSPDASIGVPGMPADLEGLKQVVPAFQKAFTNFKMDVSDVTAEGDYVAYRAVWTATHSGELMGIPASGKEVHVSETHIEKVVDGKIVEHNGDWDQMGLMQQIGAVPMPPAQ